jgi:translation elongation factor EF-G
LPGEDSNERDEAAADGDSAAPMASANEALQTREAECLIGFARIYCGTLKVGQTLHALGPKYSPFHRGLGAHNSMVTISSLYIVMGKDLEAVGMRVNSDASCLVRQLQLAILTIVQRRSCEFSHKRRII